MKNSKLFITSLIAAAAMSTVSAWAADKTITSNETISDGASYDTVSVKGGATVTQDSGTATFSRLLIHTDNNAKSETYNLNGGVLNITGGDKTAAGSIGEGNAGLIIGHWGNNGGKSTLNVASGAVLNAVSGWTFLSWDTSSALNINGEVNLYGITFSKGANYKPTATLTLAEGGRLNLGAGGFANENSNAGADNVNLNGGTLGALDSWNASVAMTLGGNVKVDTTKWVSSVSGAGASATGDDVGATITLSGNITQTAGTLTVSGAGTLALSGTSTLNGSVTVGSGATLDLSGGTLKLASAISNSGTVTVNSNTIFVLKDSLKSGDSGVYTLIDGGTINGWDASTLSLSNFRQADGTAFGGRTTAVVDTAGAVTITGVAFNLFWKGGSSGTWDTSTSTVWGKDSASGGSEKFVSGDNVTFGTSDATITLGEAITAGKVSVKENTTLAATSTNTLSADSISVSEGKTLTLSGGYTNFSWSSASLAEGSVLDLGSGSSSLGSSSSKLALSGEGTVKYSFTSSSSGGTGSGIYISDDFAGTVDYTGCLNYGSNISLGSNATLKLSSRTNQSDEIWGTSNTTIANKLIFATDYGVNVAGGTLTLSGEVSGAGTITKKNSGTVAFTGGVSGGTLSIDGGTVQVIGSARVTNPISFNDIIIKTGATLDLNADLVGNSNPLTWKKLTFQGGTFHIADTPENTNFLTISEVVMNGSGAITSAWSANSVGATLSKISGTGDLTINGGTLQSVSWSIGQIDSDYSGTIKLVKNSQALTVSVGSSTAETANLSFGDNVVGKFTGTGDYSIGSLSVGSGASLSIAASNVAVKGLSGSGAISLASGTSASALTVNQATNTEFSGTLGNGFSLIKSGAGTLTLSGANTFSGDVNINAGTLVAANASALGTGTVSVAENAKLGLVAGTMVSGVTGGVELASGAKLVVDMTSKASETETFTLDLITSSALKYNNTTITSANVGTLLDAIELSNWDKDGWTQMLSYDDSSNKLSLTMTIPEPSAFGLLAGAGALALVGARRRRKAK